MQLSRSDNNKRREACYEFLRELGRGIPDDERLMFATPVNANVQKGEDGKAKNSGFWCSPWDEDSALSVNGRHNAYVCISSFKKTLNEKTKKMRYWRSDLGFGHGLALMVDDVGNGTGSKGGLDSAHFYKILPPTVEVETSPNNFQLWYFLNMPEIDKYRFKYLLAAFAEQALSEGGDRTIKDVTRIARMPYGHNDKHQEIQHKDPETGEVINTTFEPKYADADGDLFECRIIEADYERRYDIDEIAEAFGLVMSKGHAHVRAIDVEEDSLNEMYLDLAVTICSKYGMGAGSNGEAEINASGKYRIKCPWGHEHRNGSTEAGDAYFRGWIAGAEHSYVFGCAHDTCRQNQRTWGPFIDELVMPYVEGLIVKADRLGDAWSRTFPFDGNAIQGKPTE
ncbi:DNA primase [Pseudomonas phage tabernarius]|uniref:DNA primase n=1 Tax=Pseudomonas phage tabernarius TaxID=2048978 RepID=A0A2H4P6X7_9CAUD|nr:DNA primase [Pseudomonas phage tabernarius]ATW57932.1 DNA primase [Pseudomonas phage tabernarius]